MSRKQVRCLGNKFDVLILGELNDPCLQVQCVDFCSINLRYCQHFHVNSCRLPVDCLSGCNISTSIFPVLLCVRRGSPVVSAWGLARQRFRVRAFAVIFPFSSPNLTSFRERCRMGSERFGGVSGRKNEDFWALLW